MYLVLHDHVTYSYMTTWHIDTWHMTYWYTHPDTLDFADCSTVRLHHKRILHNFVRICTSYVSLYMFIHARRSTDTKARLNRKQMLRNLACIWKSYINLYICTHTQTHTCKVTVKMRVYWRNQSDCELIEMSSCHSWNPARISVVMGVYRYIYTYQYTYIYMFMYINIYVCVYICIYI